MVIVVAIGITTGTATRPGMALIIDPGKMLKVQMSIDLCGGDVRMTKQFLHRTQVAAGLQHMAGKGVPQQVRMQALVGPLHHPPAGQAGLDAALAQTATPMTDEYRGFALVSHGCSVDRKSVV